MFAELRDPRVERTREHVLEEILLITIAALLSGWNGWNEIEDYAHSKHTWFQGFLTLPGGIPSHDTFNRVFTALDPEELEKGFVAWVSSMAIDGKTLRGASEPGRNGTDKKAIVHHSCPKQHYVRIERLISLDIGILCQREMGFPR